MSEVQASGVEDAKHCYPVFSLDTNKPPPSPAEAGSIELIAGEIEVAEIERRRKEQQLCRLNRCRSGAAAGSDRSGSSQQVQVRTGGGVTSVRSGSCLLLAVFLYFWPFRVI